MRETIMERQTPTCATCDKLAEWYTSQTVLPHYYCNGCVKSAIRDGFTVKRLEVK